MITLIERSFEVERSLPQAWRHLARVESWPSWAGHIRRVVVRPPGELGPSSVGHIQLKNGLRSAFRMSTFDPPRSWKWVGGFLHLTIHYDHRFEAIAADRTRLTWVVEATGFGAGWIGRLFARIYERTLERAIPALIEEMGSERG